MTTSGAIRAGWQTSLRSSARPVSREPHNSVPSHQERLMTIRPIRDADVRGKRVFVRVDFNVPLDGDRITDDTRIRAALPTIQHLLDHEARVILCSHLGRPKGRPVEEFRLTPVGRRLGDLLDRPVIYVPDVVGPQATARAERLQDGEVLLLENVRFEPGEEKNEPEFALKLAA